MSDDEFAQEIQSHIELEAERLRAEGVPAREALERARRKFGNVAAARERFYESRRQRFLGHSARDIRFALRALGRSPGYAAAAVLTLALGIGANTAIFSAADEILFRPPDVPHAERLAQVYSFNRKTATFLSSSYPDYLSFRQARSFENLAAYARFPLNVQLEGAPSERISVEAVSGNYFAMLAVAPLAGRALGPADDQPDAAPAALIAEELWRTRLRGDRAAIGRRVAISGQPFTIVGIVPKNVAGLNLNWATPPRVWIPLHASALLFPRFERVFGSPSMIWLVLTGRLNSGVSIGAAQAEMRAIAAHIAAGRDLTAEVYPLSRSKFWPSYRADIRTSLTGFGIAAGLILLLACANVSNLLLVRTIARRRELAVRLAIGAGRGRIVRQMLTESAVLAVLSCGAAVGVAQGLMKLLLQFPNALGLSLVIDLGIEARALLFCVGLAGLTVALFGLAPATQSARLDIVESLRQSGNAAACDGRGWFRAVLVAVQAALAMILLVGGGVYGRSLWKAYSADLGFRADHLLVAAFSLPPPAAADSDRMWNAQRTLLQTLSTTPGVVAATISSTGILSPGRPKAQVQGDFGMAAAAATFEFVAPNYFRTMGIPLIEGREGTRQEQETGATAIVNRALARSLAPAGRAIGRTISVESPVFKKARFVIVGVAGDAREGSIWEQREPIVYLPARKTDIAAGFLAVRTSAAPGELAEPLRRMWDDLAPLAPLYEIQTASERVDLALTPQRVAAGILGGFGMLALTLTGIGLYGVVAFSVAQQKQEIGIRMAIGAQPAAIFASVLRRSMAPVAAGLAAGAAAGFPLMRILASKALEVSPNDRSVYFAVAVLLAAVSGGAALAPARRAMRVDPSTALRSE